MSVEESLAGVDLGPPNPARMYDYALGGAHNFAVDREAFDALLSIDPDAALVGRTNRAFLRRAVRYCVDQGIRQFLDLGSGIPTQGHVHEIARQTAPATRVVYVDNEPVAVAHSRRLLDQVDGVAIVAADVRDPEAVLNAPETAALLDLSEPVGLLAVAVLHYVAPEDDPAALLARYLDPLAPGSLLAVSHTTVDAVTPEQAERMRELFDSTSSPVTHRDRAQLRTLLSGVDLVEPGVVWTPEWRPEGPDDLLLDEPARSGTYAAVGVHDPRGRHRRGAPSA